MNRLRVFVLALLTVTCGATLPEVTPTHPRFVRFEAPDRNNACSSDDACMTSGCSGEVCAAESIITTCEALPDKPQGECGCLRDQCVWVVTP